MEVMLLEKLAAVVLLSAALLQGSCDEALPDHDLKGTLFLINRQHMLTECYAPQTRRVQGPGMSQTMREDAATALEEMFAAAKEEGITLSIVSGYRSYSKQATIYARKKKNTGSAKKADELVARPGASEHQLGLAMDLARKGSSQLNSSFAKTKEGQWVWENCARFGFIVRYLEGSEEITGYSYEPWHVRYVGKEAAQSIMDSGLPMETWMADYKAAVYDYLIFQSASEVWQ